jgi:3-oxoacyl-[acyl-carrier protein] reductase
LTTNKIALVTGAASGIGRASASRLVKRNITTVMLDRSPEVMAVADEFNSSGHTAIGHVVELTDAAALQSYLDGLLSEHGAIDIIVNNAGIHPKKAGGKFLVEEISLADWQRVMAVNLNAPFQICAALLPAMKAKGWGRVVNISSSGARRRPVVPSSHYIASKSGIIGLTRCIAEEGARQGITANAICPSPIKTGLTTSSSPEAIARLTAEIPVGRYGEPDEIAAMVEFLVSDDASFVTGAVIDVNGGSAMA